MTGVRVSKATAEEKMKNDSMVRKYFKSAMRTEDVIRAVLKITQAQGFTPDNTLFSHSVCPDEINHEDGDITS